MELDAILGLSGIWAWLSKRVRAMFFKKYEIVIEDLASVKQEYINRDSFTNQLRQPFHEFSPESKDTRIKAQHAYAALRDRGFPVKALDSLDAVIHTEQIIKREGLKAGLHALRRQHQSNTT